MKKVIISLLLSSFLFSCSNDNLTDILPIQENVSSSSNINKPVKINYDIEIKTISNSKLLIDKMEKEENISEQEKIKASFDKEINSLTRASLEKIMTYSAKKISNSGGLYTPVGKRLAPMLNSAQRKFLIIMMNEKDLFSSVYDITQEKDSSKQKEMIAQFEKDVLKVTKYGCKMAVDCLKNQNGSSNNVFPPGYSTPLFDKLVKIIEDRINN